MDDQLKGIIRDYWEDFLEKRNLSFVRRGGFPMIWFGDIEKYLSSPLRIVTVGINPGAEFGEGSYYNQSDSVQLYNANELNDTLLSVLTRNLNSYFVSNLDKSHRWFDNYSKVLRHFNAHYYNTDNAVLHIDLQTAISTDPKWGDLRNEEKDVVKNTGLFYKFIKYLNPSIIVSSISYIEIEKCFHDLEEIQWFFVDDLYEKKNMGYITLYGNNQGQYIINGLNFKGQPYGNLNQVWANNVMDQIKNIIKARDCDYIDSAATQEAKKLLNSVDYSDIRTPEDQLEPGRVSAAKSIRTTSSSGEELFGLLCSYIRSLGNRASEKQRKNDYVFQGVCTVQVSRHLLVYINQDPRSIEQSVYDEGFIKHYMNRANPDYKCISVTIKDGDQLEKAKPYIEKAYRDYYALSL